MFRATILLPYEQPLRRYIHKKVVKISARMTHKSISTHTPYLNNPQPKRLVGLVEIPRHQKRLAHTRVCLPITVDAHGPWGGGILCIHVSKFPPRVMEGTACILRWCFIDSSIVYTLLDLHTKSQRANRSSSMPRFELGNKCQRSHNAVFFQARDPNNLQQSYLSWQPRKEYVGCLSQTKNKPKTNQKYEGG